jgi:1-deoxy-D-xylulose-5-phosphate reductoisomerase|tara:strand:- start:67671 stop:68825 length:1155 start_codon:yes stop_codon:yes gene_type:complete
MTKTVSVFGSTGSIGRSALDLIAHNPDGFKLRVLTAGKNAELLAAQAIAFKPELVVLADETGYAKLCDLLSNYSDIKITAGRQALLDAAQVEVDLTLAAIMGFAGLEPLLHSIQSSKAVAIANKEPLVAAGALFMDAAEKAGCQILPTDSEHNAIFQVFEPENVGSISRLILTASGGPFRTWARDDIMAATPAQAVNHPNWSMGAKISVDSASLMNKALEVIEAHHLFAMPEDKIDVVVHPESIVHSFVEYQDGSVLAQLGAPDMRTPIAYCLSWPERMVTSGERLDVFKLSSLNFEPLRDDVFPPVKWAHEALRSGQGACIALNASNEVAVSHFLNKDIGFAQIYTIVEQMLEEFSGRSVSGLEDIISLDKEVRMASSNFINL